MIVNNEGWKLRWARKCHADTIGQEGHHLLEWEQGTSKIEQKSESLLIDIPKEGTPDLVGGEWKEKMLFFSLSGISVCLLHVSVDPFAYQSAQRYTYLFFQEKSWVWHLPCIIFYCPVTIVDVMDVGRWECQSRAILFSKQFENYIPVNNNFQLFCSAWRKFFLP